MSEAAEHALRERESPNSSNSVCSSTQGSIVVGIDYDCRERKVYWTDVAGRTISRASLEPGAEPETIITSGQQLHPKDTICISFASTKSKILAWFMPRSPLYFLVMRMGMRLFFLYIIFFKLYKNSLSLNKHRRNELWALSIVNSMERAHSKNAECGHS